MKNKILSGIILLGFLFLPTRILAQWEPEGLSIFNLPNATVWEIISNIVKWLFAILGLVSLIAFMVAGIMYLVSSGDDTTVGRAKKAMTYSIVGVIVGLSGFVVLQAVTAMLSGTPLF